MSNKAPIVNYYDYIAGPNFKRGDIHLKMTFASPVPVSNEYLEGTYDFQVTIMFGLYFVRFLATILNVGVFILRD